MCNKTGDLGPLERLVAAEVEESPRRWLPEQAAPRLLGSAAERARAERAVGYSRSAGTGRARADAGHHHLSILLPYVSSSQHLVSSATCVVDNEVVRKPTAVAINPMWLSTPSGSFQRQARQCHRCCQYTWSRL
jgi:hypothetical protein